MNLPVALGAAQLRRGFSSSFTKKIVNFNFARDAKYCCATIWILNFRIIPILLKMSTECLLSVVIVFVRIVIVLPRLHFSNIHDGGNRWSESTKLASPPRWGPMTIPPGAPAQPVILPMPPRLSQSLLRCPQQPRVRTVKNSVGVFLKAPWASRRNEI